MMNYVYQIYKTMNNNPNKYGVLFRLSRNGFNDEELTLNRLNITKTERSKF